MGAKTPRRRDAMDWCFSFTSFAVMGRLCHSKYHAIARCTRFEVITSDSVFATLSLGFVSYLGRSRRTLYVRVELSANRLRQLRESRRDETDQWTDKVSVNSSERLHMSKSDSIPEAFRDLLDVKVAILATHGHDGAPQVTAVWFLHDKSSDQIKLSLNDKRQKVKNLRRNPHATLFILDP